MGLFASMQPSPKVAIESVGDPLNREGIVPSMPKAFGPEHWHSRAEEARTVAEILQNPEAKREMLELADLYEQIAKDAERQELGSSLRA